MKKIFFIIIVIIIAIGIFITYQKLKRSAYNVAEVHTGFNIKKECNIIEFKDKWAPNGDGESLIRFFVIPEQLINLQSKCISKNYKKLPIEEELPDNTIYNYIEETDSLGYYLLNIDKKDNRNYSIVVLDSKKKKLIIYNTIY